MANIGYVRVSSRKQHLDLQLDALIKRGCNTIFQEKEYLQNDSVLNWINIYHTYVDESNIIDAGERD